MAWYDVILSQVMRPVGGKYGGRLVFCAVRNAYEGDVPVWSDDGGKTYNFSTGVYLPGLDECNIAQSANGSLFLIARNCREGNLDKCQMMTNEEDHATSTLLQPGHISQTDPCVGLLVLRLFCYIPTQGQGISCCILCGRSDYRFHAC
jgi:hypothetical protein